MFVSSDQCGFVRCSNGKLIRQHLSRFTSRMNVSRKRPYLINYINRTSNHITLRKKTSRTETKHSRICTRSGFFFPFHLMCAIWLRVEQCYYHNRNEKNEKKVERKNGGGSKQRNRRIERYNGVHHHHCFFHIIFHYVRTKHMYEISNVLHDDCLCLVRE